MDLTDASGSMSTIANMNFARLFLISRSYVFLVVIPIPAGVYQGIWSLFCASSAASMSPVEATALSRMRFRF